MYVSELAVYMSPFSQVCSHRGAECRREQLAPLQQEEAIDIRRRSDAFAEKVEGFGKFFQRRAPFALTNPPLTLEHVRGPTSAIPYLPASQVQFMLNCMALPRLTAALQPDSLPMLRVNAAANDVQAQRCCLRLTCQPGACMKSAAHAAGMHQHSR